MPKLPQSFYLREDVLQITKELLGKFLVTKINGAITGGMMSRKRVVPRKSVGRRLLRSLVPPYGR